MKPDLSWVSRSDTLKFFCSSIDWHRTSSSSDMQTQRLRQIMLIAQSRVISPVLSCWSNLDFFQYPVPRGCLINLIIDSPSAYQWLVEEWSCDTLWPISRSLLWCGFLGKVFLALHELPRRKWFQFSCFEISLSSCHYFTEIMRENEMKRTHQ